MSWKKAPRREGVDVALGQVSEQHLGEILASCLVSKGFCVVDLGEDQRLEASVAAEVARLHSAGSFHVPPAAVADGLLGAEGSSKIAELPPPTDSPIGPDEGLRAVDETITNMTVTLSRHFEDLGFEMTHRSNAVVNETGVPEVGPELTEKDVAMWLDKFLRHKIMVLIFMGPLEGVLRLQVYDTLVQGTDAYEVKTGAGIMVVLRPDIMSHHHVALGRTIAISSFFIKACGYNKHHATGGWIMCPAAKALDRWAMERCRVLKGTMEADVEWNEAVPREFQRVMNLQGADGTTTAIRGLCVKFPATWDVDAWFKSFACGADTMTDVPYARWDHDRYYDPHPEGWKYGKTYSKHLGVVDGLHLFDNKLFGLSINESRTMDPNQRLILEVGYAALYRMGYKNKRLMNTTGSVYVGHSGLDWGFVEKSAECSGVGPTGNAGCINANRLSFIMGMKGPSMNIDTENASGLTAVYMTAESMQSKGRGAAAELGVAVSSAVALHPLWWPSHCGLGWISNRGRCLTFDQSATGYVHAEGVAGVAMKPVAEKIDGVTLVGGEGDEEPLEGVLCGACMKVAGKSASLWAPSAMAAQEVMLETCRIARLSPLDIDAVEADGIASYLADTVEVAATQRVYRPDVAEGPDVAPLAVTAVKSVVGNQMESGGVAGLIKIVLGARRSVVAPGLHLREENAVMGLGDICLQLLSESLEYPRASSLSAVTSRGTGGSNVNCVTWGQLDERQVRKSPENVVEQIVYWPGGGGFLDTNQQPVDGYYIVGSWTEWMTPLPMEREGEGQYGYTLTLGANGWEQFQLCLDGELHRTLYPEVPKAPKASKVLGPEGRSDNCWLLEARPPFGAAEAAAAEVEAAAEAAMLAAPAEGDPDQGDSIRRIMPAESVDVGRPGAKYRIHLRTAGRWRAVDWEKIEEAEGSAPLPPECVGKYYVQGSWSCWQPEAMQETDAKTRGKFHFEVTLLHHESSFQIVRNKDPAQVFYPAGNPASGEAQGPDEWDGGAAWRIDGQPGDTFRIEFCRPMERHASPTAQLEPGAGPAEPAEARWQRIGHRELSADELQRSRLRRYAVAGTWDRLKRVMEWNQETRMHTLLVRIGEQESFQILEEGSWQRVLHPSEEDAGPSVPHFLLGPSSSGSDCFWTIGTGPEEEARVGARMLIQLHLDKLDRPVKVDWVPAP